MNLKEYFYSPTEENISKLLYSIIKIQIFTIYFIIAYIGVVLIMLNKKTPGIIILVSAIIYFFASRHSNKMADFYANINFEILKYLLRYGKVVTWIDWRKVKKYSKKLYRDLRSQESYRKCYLYSRKLAMCLDDAQLVYCNIQVRGRPGGHVVILKDNCIYCTNSKAHFNYEEYFKGNGGEIYKIFSKEEYSEESFFADIRQGFKEWCIERNAYCDPE